MREVVNSQYELLRKWVDSLPAEFDKSGEVIYDARNQIRRIVPKEDGWGNEALTVKRFHTPLLPNRVVYSCMREPKAARAYYNAVTLLQRGIATPEPVAFVLCGRYLLRESYLVTRESRLTHLMRDFTLNYRPELDELIRPFARFTARMHEQRVLHLDYSPGNILWDKKDDEYLFEVIDINRMRIGKEVTLRDGCESMRRICARTSFFKVFADEYARARGFDAEETERMILHYRDRFWDNGKKAKYEYD
ncbi:MAG: tyrosine protein kinase [Paludibacteraceae bacterium]|nr:tyrosine protein kinase [Paludibacteraceae bacterium]